MLTIQLVMEARKFCSRGISSK